MQRLRRQRHVDALRAAAPPPAAPGIGRARSSRHSTRHGRPSMRAGRPISPVVRRPRRVELERGIPAHDRHAEPARQGRGIVGLRDRARPPAAPRGWLRRSAASASARSRVARSIERADQERVFVARAAMALGRGARPAVRRAASALDMPSGIACGPWLRPATPAPDCCMAMSPPHAQKAEHE